MNTRAEFFVKDQPLADEPYHLKGIGLPNVYLLNGFELEEDPDYGRLVSITNQDGLMRAIGLSIVSRPATMTGAELRFLRKQMEMTQKEFGAQIGVTDQTIANYEKGVTKLSTAAFMAALLYVLHVMPPETNARVLRDIVGQMPKHREQGIRPELQTRKLVGNWNETRLAA